MAERGAVHLVVATLLFAATLMMGLAVDITRIGIAWREASHLAATAAEAGAGWIDQPAAYDDRLTIDPGAARTAALAAASGHDGVILVTASPERVCVQVRTRVNPTLLSLIGADSQNVSATACAEPRMG